MGDGGPLGTNLNQWLASTVAANEVLFQNATSIKEFILFRNAFRWKIILFNLYLFTHFRHSSFFTEDLKYGHFKQTSLIRLIPGS